MNLTTLLHRIALRPVTCAGLMKTVFHKAGDGRKKRRKFSRGLTIEPVKMASERRGSACRIRLITLPRASEVELGETVKLITDHIQSVDPARVVIDTLSELRLLAADQLRYRRQLLALKRVPAW